ncbi:hypothetical protein [Luteolibacter sp. LG18]|uniref:hypothetical protein n=1 Tax=Luteolibacter sp. LG18 TaxID=2819286 RepID=UPI002B28D64B|nr:hypothetical protein llg_37920 [Luteolibacter sp. LG18]
MGNPELPVRFSLFAAALLAPALANAALEDRLEAAHERLLDNRRDVIPTLSDPYGVPPAASVVIENPRERFRGPDSWHRNVVSTVFWVGEQPSQNNPTPNRASAWDQNWQENFGGYDHPERRKGYFPADFTPALNPFYIALPYNDIGRDGRHRPEAPEVIPWFWEDYRGDGISVCKDRWVAIHHKGRVCYAQWEDVGPFVTDHWQYVFGKEDPRPNRNSSAGIDLSPAVRDFLGLRSGEQVEWRFTHDRDVPRGPWRSWSDAPLAPVR